MAAVADYSHDRQMIILYYCYPPTSIPTKQLEVHANFHREACQQLNLGGRIRVSEEGINGVLSGREDKLRKYDAELRKELMSLLYSNQCREVNSCREDPTREWLDMKYCHLRKDIPVEKQLFDSLSVKITREVVSLIEPADKSNRNNENNGRTRCRQRRKQRRREKQRHENLREVNSVDHDLGGFKADGCDDATEPTVKGDLLKDDTLSLKNLVDDSHTQQDVNGIEFLPTALQIQDWEKHTPAVHLSPMEWNEKLLQYSQEHMTHDPNQMNSNDVILLDTRNIYETRIGHFAVPKVETFFPNTRKFSSLPQALNTEQAASALAGKHIFMYCTGKFLVGDLTCIAHFCILLNSSDLIAKIFAGGVRCERAGSYLRALSESNSGAWVGKDQPKGIYQLRGGIQNYLATFGREQSELYYGDNTNSETSERESDKICLYRGKNFVFDPRRTDPIIGEGTENYTLASHVNRLTPVGHCIICSCPHDDYDNGHIPAEEKEARCCRCRVLVLVCNNCRQRVRCWGDPQDDPIRKMDLFCGNDGIECVDEGNVAAKIEIVQY